jgi:large subunit ribosomal protein L6
MSRTIKTPLPIPHGVKVLVSDATIHIQGPRGAISQVKHYLVQCQIQEENIWFVPIKPQDRRSIAMAGTLKALCRNHIRGVVEEYIKRLQLVGVGYRAEVQGSELSINLGYSHPIKYSVPKDIKITTPQPTEIIVQGLDKYQVGQVAAEIRSFRKPEPYKGKGVRYFEERILMKETKKK